MGREVIHFSFSREARRQIMYTEKNINIGVK